MKRIVISMFLLAVTGAFAQAPAGKSAVALDPAAKRAFVEKAMTLRAGDTYETVIQRLGKPAVDRSTTGAIATRTLKYHVRKSGSDTNPLNEHVDIYLDKKNRVDGIYLNVELR